MGSAVTTPDDWGRVAVGTRLGSGMAPTAFFDSWTGLVHAGLRDGDVVLPSIARQPQHWAMNYVVEQFLATDADSLLSIDNDHSFTADSLERLRSRPEGQMFDVLGGLYLARNSEPPHGVLMRLHPDTPNRNHRQGNVLYQWGWRWPPGDVVDVDGLGLGFTLIRRQVFETLPRPWFWFPPHEWKTSEDLPFCSDARDAGFRLGVDTSVCIGHLLDAALSHPGPDYERLVHERLNGGEAAESPNE